MPNNHSSERPDFIEQIRAESRGLKYRPANRKKSKFERPTEDDSHRLFTVEKGNRWMELARSQPKARMLFGELWHQGELCMMFADSNIGKSVLAVQIAESIARRQKIVPFACQATGERVLYIDFELSDLQFGQRYSNGADDHDFSDNFYRARYNYITDHPENVDENELLITAIEHKIKLVKAKVVIIDNITCLRGGTENSTVALSLMKSLKALKTEHNLSILVLAHTPKRRNPSQPISADDLHGSKLLINFADSAFAIGKSTAETQLLYLKQIKQRNTSQRYGADNICLGRIHKTGCNLHFQFEGYSHESLHLLARATAQRQQIAIQVVALSASGLSQREISKRLNIGLATVNRIVQRECADVQMRGCADDVQRASTEQMREYADDNSVSACEKGKCAKEECANFQMRGCADDGKEASTHDMKMPTGHTRGFTEEEMEKDPYYPDERKPMYDFSEYLASLKYPEICPDSDVRIQLTPYINLSPVVKRDKKKEEPPPPAPPSLPRDSEP